MNILQPKSQISSEDLKFFRVTQIAYLVGFFGHFLACGLFWLIGVYEMVWFNALISVPFFAVALLMNWNGYRDIAFSFAFFELFVHQILGACFLGWAFGFQYWLIYLAGLCFFNSLWSRSKRLLIFMLVFAGLLGVFFYAQDGVYNHLSAGVVRFSSAANMVLATALLALLINYFARLAREAEQNLKQEKEITEQQNQQLSKQHEALERPIDTNNTEEGKANNRRVTLRKI